MSDTTVDPRIILGQRADGRPIFAIMGGSGDEAPAEGTTPPEGDADDDQDAPPADADEESDEDDDSGEDEDSKKFWETKAKKNANEARNLRTRTKELAKRNAELEQYEKAAKAKADSEKSELEVALEKIAELTAANTTLKKTTALGAVKDRYDFPAKVLSQLEGETEEELLESADEWAEELGIERKDAKPKVKRTPRPKADDVDGGRDPGKQHTPSLQDQIAAATKDGNTALSLRLKSQALFAQTHTKA